MKKILTIILCTFMLFLYTPTTYAKEVTLPNDETYRIVNVLENGQYEIIKTADSYADAKVSHTLLRSKYNNLGITYGNTFLTIEYGVVAFDKAKDCSLNIAYTNAQNDEKGYTNGCYGVDAAFLEHNLANGLVKFQLSGVDAWADFDDLTIFPIEKAGSISAFRVRDAQLYHNLQSSIQSSTYDNAVLLSKAPAYLKKDTQYFSYDSHYFYTDFKKMIQDVRLGNHKQAVNVNEPYYNYFQYIDHRTTSSYDEQSIRSYFKDTLAINASISSFYDKDNYIHDILTQSMLFDTAPAFLQYQSEFGANALLMLSLSMNESAIGKSVLAYTRNNVFGHAAYDSDVDKNASRYGDVTNSIYSHALHYISNSYLSPGAFQFHGGFFGNKAGGMNVAYASDPYWGEKAAQYAYEIDQAMGGKDLHQYTLGIGNKKAIAVYKDASDKGKPLYTMPKGNESAFIVLEKITNKEGTWYRVQSDPALKDDKSIQKDGLYSFRNSYGYIKADTIVTLLNGANVKDKSYMKITFEANGGTFYPERKQVTLEVENGRMPSVTLPTKDHALFEKWDKDITTASKDTTYKAIYRDVKQISIATKPSTDYALGDTIDVLNGTINVEFRDGKNEEVTITTNMISGYDAKKEGKQSIKVTYGGTSTSYEIHVSKKKETLRSQISSTANLIIRNYTGKTNLNEEGSTELQKFKESVDSLSYTPFSKEQMRDLDKIFQANSAPRTSIALKGSTYDLQVSGLRLALQGDGSLLHKIMPKTIVISASDSIQEDDRTLADKVSKANYMRVDGELKMSGKDDFSSLKLKSEMIFSIKKPAGTTSDRLYKIYYVDGEDVYQVPTTQTKNRIQFVSEHLGSYIIVSQSVHNLKDSDDVREVNTMNTNGQDYITTFIILPLGIILLSTGSFFAYVLYRRKQFANQHMKKKRKRTSEPCE